MKVEEGYTGEEDSSFMHHANQQPEDLMYGEEGKQEPPMNMNPHSIPPPLKVEYADPP